MKYKKYTIALETVFTVTNSYSASALDVSSICKKVVKDLDSYINRGSHYLISDQGEIPLSSSLQVILMKLQRIAIVMIFHLRQQLKVEQMLP